MKVYKGFGAALPKSPRSVAIGVFDGVHRGHRKILAAAIADARRNGRKAAVVTFDPHPVKVLSPRHALPVLMSLSHRLRQFGKLGVDESVVVRFNKAFARTPHQDFLEKFLIGRLGMRMLAVGHDFCFGRGGAGDERYLKKESRRRGFRLNVTRALRHGGAVISSTRIRKLIEKGRLEAASRMLGRPVSVYGDVIRGKGRGRSLGFPTANINPHHETLPPSGVYAAKGYLGKKQLKGVIHIGPRPTFAEKERSVEVHFFHFRGDLYGRELELIFVKRLRPIRRFKGRAELVRAIRSDIAAARRALSK